jgi:hypothetical protein
MAFRGDKPRFMTGLQMPAILVPALPEEVAEDKRHLPAGVPQRGLREVLRARQGPHDSNTIVERQIVHHSEPLGPILRELVVRTKLGQVCRRVHVARLP